jgi:ABC-type multidrug transport system fused ATPase/permease subunit
MNIRRTMLWLVAFIAALVGVLLVLITVGFVPDYFSDKSHADKATFLGTLLGAVALIVLIVQFLAWFRRRGSRDSVAMRLRVKLGKDLDRRPSDMRRTAEDIALTYRSFDASERADLDGLVDIILHRSGRVVLAGQPGIGKSYTALQVAAALMRQDRSIVPLVVPLSRWTGAGKPERRLARFLEDEYNVAAVTARELVDIGAVVPPS